MRAIERGGLLVIPRVSDMHNGMFRPEVAWSKGRASDIVYGDCFSTKLRAEIGAVQAASLVFLRQAKADALWEETSRSIAGCHLMLAKLMAQIC